MSLTITITDVKASNWTVDLDKQNVVFNCKEVDAQGNTIIGNTAVFWVTMPAIPGPDDYQLPSNYVQILLDLTNTAETVIKNRKGI